VNINRAQQLLAAKHGLSTIPKLIEIIAALPEAQRDRLAPFLRTKPVRSASGVAVVAVMCKPHRCPHLAFTGGVCVYWCVGRGGRCDAALPPPPAPRHSRSHARTRTPATSQPRRARQRL
jgi:histone acetyltransferase (RNA polymerase elongator complex component)